MTRIWVRYFPNFNFNFSKSVIEDCHLGVATNETPPATWGKYYQQVRNTNTMQKI